MNIGEERSQSAADGDAEVLKATQRAGSVCWNIGCLWDHGCWALPVDCKR